MALGTGLATSFVAEAKFEQPTGATAAALAFVGEPERTGSGWTIGVGDKSRTGDRDEPAPGNTLRDFFEYLQQTGVEVRPSNWWGLPSDLKKKLAMERRGGKFGGRGPGYANYLWVQNEGNARAGITGTHFLDRAINSWKAKVPDIIEAYLAQA